SSPPRPAGCPPSRRGVKNTTRVLPDSTRLVPFPLLTRACVAAGGSFLQPGVDVLMASSEVLPSEPPPATAKKLEQVESVVIHFSADRGDGLRLVAGQFTNVSAAFGNDVSPLPDFPAEIRAPAGTLAGVSGFQLNFSSRDIFTPGDAVDTLVAMNPAALKTN